MSGTKKKTKAEEAKQAEQTQDLFDDPGTAASVPEEEREHFDDTDQGVEHQLAKAEEVLGEDLPKKPRRASKRAAAAQADKEAEIEQEMQQIEERAYREEIDDLLAHIERVVPQHADIAAKAHRRNIHSAFLTLLERAKNVKKLTDGQAYWRQANS